MITSMDQVEFWPGIVASLTGQAKLRLIAQPTVAALLGIRVGLHDAKEGRTPFLWNLITGKQRALALKEAIGRIVVPLLFAVVLDSVLQAVQLHRVRLLAAVIVGGILIFLPFAAARGLANRVASRNRRGGGPLRQQDQAQ
jgi:hypothetical protein